MGSIDPDRHDQFIAKGAARFLLNLMADFRERTGDGAVHPKVVHVVRDSAVTVLFGPTVYRGVIGGVLLLEPGEEMVEFGNLKAGESAEEIIVVFDDEEEPDDG